MLPVLALGLVALTGCGASAGAGGGERPCTLIGAVPGISLEIAPRPGPPIAEADLTACWGPGCRTWRPELHPATTTKPHGCTGAGPDESCSARMRYTGGWSGFADVGDLREGPVGITVVLRDAGGREVARTTQNTAAHLVFPNGPKCGGGVPQVKIQI